MIVQLPHINNDKKTDFNDLTTIRTALMRRLQRRYYHNYHFLIPVKIMKQLPHYATLRSPQVLNN
jgi:hypothetical protein